MPVSDAGPPGSRERGPDAKVQLREGTLLPPAGRPLEHGGQLADFRIAYSLHGAPEAPVVAVLGGISADRRVADDGEGGWWGAMVGAGRPLDLRSRRVLSIDWLGGAGESARLLVGGDAPLLTPRDQALALATVVKALGIDRLDAVIGASYGGAVALAFAAQHADRVGRVMAIGAAHRSHPMATAVRVVQRRIVQRGVDAGDPEGGLALARALAMTTYRSEREFEERFSGPPSLDGGEPRFPVEDYIDHHGEAFAGRFTAAQFLTLSRSMDLHFVEPESIRAPVTLVSIEPDPLAPRWLVEELAARVPGDCEVVRIDSPHGHDAFLTDTELFSRVLGGFLGRVDAQRG